MMEESRILQEFKDADAILTGHFVLSSGLRSPMYVQCARVLIDARRADRLCKALAEKLKQWAGESSQSFDIIVSPAMGGVVVGYEMGRQLGLPAIFCERVDGVFALRRGFGLEKGQRVLIVEDVVTTGKSSMEAVACIEQYGAKAVAVASLIDRRSDNDVGLTLPLISLLKLDIPTYAPDALPDALKAIEPVKPGSRFLFLVPSPKKGEG